MGLVYFMSTTPRRPAQLFIEMLANLPARMTSDCLGNFSSLVILRFRGMEHGLLNRHESSTGNDLSQSFYSSDTHFHLYPVYKARRKPGAEAVIDIDNRDAGGAGIKHSQKGCEPMKARAVANAGRHGNYRLID